MRKRRSRQDEEDASVDLTPMLDVVFIMLIFFIVSTSFVKESGISITRPTASTAESKAKSPILVGISADQTVWIDKREIDLGAVRANIERLKAESPEGGVVIQADKESPTGILVAVMDQIRQAGVKDISLAADGNK